MRRLKHEPELVAWGEAFHDEETGTKWFAESIYPIHEQTSINMLDRCELPVGQYVIRTFYYVPDDSVYTNIRSFNLTNEMLYNSDYDSDGIYDSFNGEMVNFTISYWIDGDVERPVVSIFSQLQGPGEDEEGSLTYKLWRVA